MNETWLKIKGFPGYEVSNLGRIRSFRRGNRWHHCAVGETSKILVPQEDKRWGYWHVGLRTSDGERINLLVHKLVAEAFIGPCPEGEEVNHWDGDKSHNFFENLKYSTPSENQKHAHRIGLTNPIKGTDHPMHKLTEEQVLQIRADRGNGVTLVQLAEQFSVAFQTISDICKRKTWGWL